MNDGKCTYDTKQNAQSFIFMFAAELMNTQNGDK